MNKYLYLKSCENCFYVFHGHARTKCPQCDCRVGVLQRIKSEEKE